MYFSCVRKANQWYPLLAVPKADDICFHCHLPVLEHAWTWVTVDGNRVVSCLEDVCLQASLEESRQK